MNIAVTGGDGVLGRALRAFLPDARFLSRAECDVRDFHACGDIVSKADVVIHAAALTDHQHPNAAEVIESNIIGTRNIAWLCRTYSKRLVYLSTHYVYPGVKGDYAEFDATKPIGTYAWSKFAGEQWAMTAQVDNLIVRGSWYTHATRVAHWLRNGALTDAWCSREPVESAARKIAALARSDVRGVVNIGGPRRTFYEIASAECPGVEVKPITRATLDLMRVGPSYAFPRDVSVSTAKFDALGLDV